MNQDINQGITQSIPNNPMKQRHSSLAQKAQKDGLEDGVITQSELNFSDTQFLLQYTFKKICQFFQEYIYLDEYDILNIDIERFSHAPYNPLDEVKEQQQENDERIIDLDLSYPEFLQKQIELTDDNKTIEIIFPQIQFTIKEASITQSYTLTQNELRGLFSSNFKEIYSLVSKYLSFEDIKKAIKENEGKINKYNKYEIGDEIKDCQIQTQNNESQSLFDLFESKHKFVLLIFIPKIKGYELSKNELIQIKEMKRRLDQKSITPCVVCGEQIEDIKQIIENLKSSKNQVNIDYPIISDFDKSISQRWGFFKFINSNQDNYEVEILPGQGLVNNDKTVLYYEQLKQQQDRNFDEIEFMVGNIAQKQK